MRWLSRFCLVVWLTLLVLGSLLPGVPPADAVVGFSGAAYAAHAVAYAVLCMLAAWALGLRGGAALLRMALGAFLLGVLLECVQPLTGRAFDLADMAANAAGVAVGLAVIFLTHCVTRRREACTG